LNIFAICYIKVEKKLTFSISFYLLVD